MTTTTTSFRNLITKSMITKQISKIACTIMLVFSMIACKKEGPATRDSIAPKSTLLISGNGFSKTYYSDSDYTYGQLNLKPNATYNFTLTGADVGGLRSLEIQLPTEFVLGTITSVTAHTERTSGLSKIISVIGTESDPYTSFVINGSFTTNNFNGDFGVDIRTGARDYGNLISPIHVSCLVTSQPPYGYGWISIF
jgi:hypothetical protein